MSGAQHETIQIERVFDHGCAEVFAAWTTVEAKQQWFVGPPKWVLVERQFDFRVDGRELLIGLMGGKMKTCFTAHYHDIIPEQRIVYDFSMHLDDKIHSVSLATVLLEAHKAQTKMTYTEQITFLDGTPANGGGRARVTGTQAHFDKLAEWLQSG